MSVTTNAALTGIPASGGSSSAGSFTSMSSSYTPAAIGDGGLEATSDTISTLKYKGSDGVVRSLELGPLE